MLRDKHCSWQISWFPACQQTALQGARYDITVTLICTYSWFR